MIDFLAYILLFSCSGALTYMFGYFSRNPSINFSENPINYIAEAIFFLAIAIFGLTKAIKKFYSKKHESDDNVSRRVRDRKSKSD